MTTRQSHMFDALDGLAVGDALGAQFFIMGRSVADLIAGRPPVGPWEWTDDTEMACTLVDEIQARGDIDQDRLAAKFARRWDPRRDYGFAATGILRRIREGESWRAAAGRIFDGQGSCGNGAAMRVAPLGAYHAGDPAKITSEAGRSARVTHMHPEGVVGAVAVALAAGQAAEARRGEHLPAPGEFVDSILRHLEPGETRTRIRRAGELLGASVREVAGELGNGSRVMAQDTVPFTIWVAATHLADYPSAIAACLEADGDMDTTCAIVGGIVAAHTGRGTRPGAIGVPPAWLEAREPLPRWLDQTNREQRRRRLTQMFRRERQ